LSAIMDRCQRHLGKLKKKSELIGRGGGVLSSPCEENAWKKIGAI
jgi:hypothetical protein